MAKLKIYFCLTALAAVTAGPASAGVESFSYTSTPAQTPFTTGFTLPSFQTWLGTLTSIQITLATSGTAEVDIFNNTGSTQNFTNATASIPVSVTGPGGLSLSETLGAGPFSGTVAAGVNVFSGLPLSTSSSMFVSPVNFASFEDPPSALNLSFSFNGSTGTYAGSAPPNVFFGGSNSVLGTTTITYTYTDAPEPMSLALLGAGLAGLGMVRRRHRV